MSRAQAEVEISNELGLHLRAASAFAKMAETFESEVTLAKGSNEANGKSIIALVTLAASPGSVVTITAEGEDAEEAVQALFALIESGFGEGT